MLVATTYLLLLFLLNVYSTPKISCHKPYRKPVRRLGDGVEGGGESSGDITDLPMPAMTVTDDGSVPCG